MPDEVKIPISLPGAAQAAADAGKVATGLQGIGNASAGAAKAVGENQKAAAGLGEELQSLGSRQNAAKDVIEGVDMASRGGAAGFFGLAKAAKNLWEILSSASPLGRLVQIAAVVGASFLALREKFFGTAEGAKAVSAAADESRDAFDKAKTALDLLNAAKLESLKTEIEAIASQSKAALELMDKLRANAQKVDEAKTGVALAEINADESLTPEQKKEKAFALQQAAADRKLARENEDRIARAATLAQEAAALNTTASGAEAARDASGAKLDAFRTQRATLNELAQNLLAEFGRKMGLAGDDSQAKAKIAQDFEIRRKQILDASEFSTGPQADARFALREAEFKAAETAAKEARKKADEANQRAAVARDDANRDNDVETFVRNRNRKRDRIAAGLPEAEERGGSTSTITGGEINVRGFNGDEIGTRISDKVNQRMREGEEAILRALERRLEQNSQIGEWQTKSLRR